MIILKLLTNFNSNNVLWGRIKNGINIYVPKTEMARPARQKETSENVLCVTARTNMRTLNIERWIRYSNYWGWNEGIEKENEKKKEGEIWRVYYQVQKNNGKYSHTYNDNNTFSIMYLTTLLLILFIHIYFFLSVPYKFVFINLV